MGTLLRPQGSWAGFMTTMRIALVSLVAVLTATTALADPPPRSALAELEERAVTENTPPNVRPEFQRDVARLVQSGALTTAEEFCRAGKLAVSPIPSFRSARIPYELFMVAVARGDRSAEAWLRTTWDGLMHTLGRPFRFDVYGLAARDGEEAGFTFDATAPVISDVWGDPDKARDLAAKAVDNPEVKELVDADQGARKGTADHNPEKLRAMASEDRRRGQRMREIINEGGLRTAADFARAALVLQHSNGFKGYQLAHELAVCSLLLGDRGRGRWLVAATYDRMLMSVGHDQRFGTQGMLMIGPGKPQLDRVDEEGICDAQRLALGCATLSAKRADFYARPPAGAP